MIFLSETKKTPRIFFFHIPPPRYDAFRVGEGGGGGEYVPQTGFGWSNGVAMVLRLGVEGNGDAITMVKEEFHGGSNVKI